MVIICSKCEGLLEVSPNGLDDASICSARCGHVFHISCLRDHWQEHRRLSTNVEEFKVPCPICRFAYRPAIFEMFPSTREITFVAAPDGNGSEAIVALRQRFETISLQRDAAHAELKEKEERFDKNAKQLLEMQNHRQQMIRERDAAKKEFHDHLMETSNNQKLTSEIFPKSGGNGNESKDESIEINIISGDAGSKPQMIFHQDSLPKIQSTSTTVRRKKVQPKVSENCSASAYSTKKYNLRKSKKVFYKI